MQPSSLSTSKTFLSLPKESPSPVPLIYFLPMYMLLIVIKCGIKLVLSLTFSLNPMFRKSVHVAEHTLSLMFQNARWSSTLDSHYFIFTYSIREGHRLPSTFHYKSHSEILDHSLQDLWETPLGCTHCETVGSHLISLSIARILSTNSA